MSAGDEKPPRSPEEVLRPANFLGYVASATQLFRAAGRKVAPGFALLGIVLSLATLGAVLLAGSADSQRGLMVVFYAQLLALPFFASMLAARTSLVMSRSLAGQDSSVRTAGAELKLVRSHLLAAVMVAAFLSLVLFFGLGPMGGALGAHIVLGPPVLIQVIALEKRPFDESWIRMRELLRGSALRVFLYVLCVALAVLLVEVVVGGVIYTLLSRVVGVEPAIVVNTPISGALSGLGLSFMSALGLVAYFDLRSKAEEDFEVADLEGDDDPEDQ